MKMVLCLMMVHLLKLSETGFRWVCGDEYAGEWLKEQAKKEKP